MRPRNELRGLWRIDPGRFTVGVGESSGDIRLRAEVTIPGDGVPNELTEQSTLGEWLDHPICGRLLRERLNTHHRLWRIDDIEPMGMATALDIPLVRFNGPPLGLDHAAIDALVTAARPTTDHDAESPKETP